MIQDVFAALADPTRRAILEQLQSGERAVGELVEVVDASQPTVSKHLRVLREIGLVSQRAAGQRRYYRVEAQPLREAADLLVRFAQGGAADLTSGHSADPAHEADDLPAAAPELAVTVGPAPDSIPAPEPKPLAEPEPEPEPEPHPAPAAEIESESLAGTGPEPEPGPVAEVEPESELAPEPGPKPEAVESQIGIDPVDAQRLDPYAVRSASESGPRHARPLTVGGLVSSMLRRRRR